MKKRFYKSEGKILSFDANDLKDHLESGVYDLKEDKGNFYLQEREGLKSFDMYGDTSFYDRIIREFNLTDTNLGCWFHGLAGAGKTVAANYICNQLNLPVICVTESHNGKFVSYLSEIKQKFVAYFDEADKIFKHNHKERDNTDDLLTLLDGKFETNILFLLTSNKLIDNQYLYNRLGRIKYFKQFTGVKLDAAEEIVDKTLVHVHHKDNLMKLFDSIKQLTFDTIQTIVDDVNKHDENPFHVASHLCLMKVSDPDAYISFNLHINGESFDAGKYDSALTNGFLVIRGHKYKNKIGDYLSSISGNKLKLSEITVDDITQLDGSHEYDYSATIDGYDGEVYLSIVPDKTQTSKLFKHFSE